jgi:hypothetical protein
MATLCFRSSSHRPDSPGMEKNIADTAALSRI